MSEEPKIERVGKKPNYGAMIALIGGGTAFGIFGGGLGYMLGVDGAVPKSAYHVQVEEDNRNFLVVESNRGFKTAFVHGSEGYKKLEDVNKLEVQAVKDSLDAELGIIRGNYDFRVATEKMLRNDLLEKVLEENE